MFYLIAKCVSYQHFVFVLIYTTNPPPPPTNKNIDTGLRISQS